MPTRSKLVQLRSLAKQNGFDALVYTTLGCCCLNSNVDLPFNELKIAPFVGTALCCLGAYHLGYACTLCKKYGFSDSDSQISDQENVDYFKLA
jgi:hypothetical protein